MDDVSEHAPEDVSAPGPGHAHAEAPAKAGDDPQQRAAYTVYRRPQRRRYQTARDMVLSLGAIGLAVAVLLAITYRTKPDPVHVVDPSAAVTDVKVLGGWPVSEPSSRLTGWRLTVARHDTTAAGAPVLALGWVTPRGSWVGVQESAAVGADARRWRDSFLPASWRRAVAYQQNHWTVYADLLGCSAPCVARSAPRSYAQIEVGTGAHRATYIVYGQAPNAELDAVMAALAAGAA